MTETICRECPHPAHKPGKCSHRYAQARRAEKMLGLTRCCECEHGDE